MIRAFIFLIKIALIIGVIVFIAGQDGSVALTWGEYAINATLGVFLTMALIVFLCLTFILKAIDMVLHIPDVLARRRAQKRHDKGYTYLTRGLTAVAAGDKKRADHYAQKTYHYMPDDAGLSLLLRAQAAQLKGDQDAAQTHFKTLMHNSDTAFLGISGLLNHSDIKSDDDILRITHDALKSYPNHAELVQIQYQTHCRQNHWSDALKILSKIKRLNIMSAEKTTCDTAALYTLQARERKQNGLNIDAIKLYKKSLKTDISFVSAMIELHDVCMRENKRRTARTSFKNVWAHHPHIDLIAVWGDLMPQSKNKTFETQLSWFEQLIEINDSPLSYLACAQKCAEQGLREKAYVFMKKGEAAGAANQRYYRLWQDMLINDPTTDQAELSRIQDKTTEAPPEKQWVCQESGMIFPFWKPFSTPQAPFNSVTLSNDFFKTASADTVLIA